MVLWGPRRINGDRERTSGECAQLASNFFRQGLRRGMGVEPEIVDALAIVIKYSNGKAATQLNVYANEDTHR